MTLMMNGAPLHHNISMSDRNPYNLPPDERNSCFVTGIPVFCAKLSPSFALFTIQQQKFNVNNNDGGGGVTTTNNNPTEQSSLFPPLFFDVIVSRKKKKGSHDIAASDHLSSIVEEVERCQTHNIPVRVHGYQPYERCTCSNDCQHSVMYCWNVNELQIPKQQLQQEQSSPIVVSSSDSSPQNSHYPLLNNNICREVNDCNNVPPPTQLLQLSIPTKSKQQQQKKRRPGVKNRNRSVHFAELLVDIFGHETLKQRQQQSPSSPSSCGILDVAGGGTGGLSFELSLRRGFPCTTIDPRPIKYNKAQRNAINFRQHSRQLLNPGLNVSHRANVLYNRFAEEWQPMQIQTLFNDEFASTDQGNTMLRECVAVVGIHPDEATDDIIQLAMRYNKPWVICPCCVFPKTFIHRRLPDGREVKTYEDLCEYIKNMPGNVREVTLGFEGRNKVYYSLPEG